MIQFCFVEEGLHFAYPKKSKADQELVLEFKLFLFLQPYNRVEFAEAVKSFSSLDMAGMKQLQVNDFNSNCKSISGFTAQNLQLRGVQFSNFPRGTPTNTPRFGGSSR